MKIYYWVISYTFYPPQFHERRLPISIEVEQPKKVVGEIRLGQLRRAQREKQGRAEGKGRGEGSTRSNAFTLAAHGPKKGDDAKAKEKGHTVVGKGKEA